MDDINDEDDKYPIAYACMRKLACFSVYFLNNVGRRKRSCFNITTDLGKTQLL